MEAAAAISLLNAAAVSIFGDVLSASFCGVLEARRNRRVFWAGMLLLLIFQGMVYLLCGEKFWRQIYPLMMHLPLLLLLRYITGRWLWPAISILTAYLFCEMRRWPALLALAVLSGGKLTQDLTELAFTVPLLLIFLRAAPAVRQLMEYSVMTQCLFGLIPALYCGFDYVTKTNTDLFRYLAVVEFMPTACCGAYLIFLLYNSAEERKRSMLRQVQDNLKVQVTQAAKEINALRAAQKMAAQHRHDLRHHMQYLLSCIENGQTGRAKTYIFGVCEEIKAEQVQRWCENEAANLILSAFAKRAKDAGIELAIAGTLPNLTSVSDSDLCVILSNALENALHACLPLAEKGTACAIGVEFRFQEQNDRLFLQITNPVQENVQFEKGVPVSSQPGHGIGVQSICAIVERYGGRYSFLTENGTFILRLFL